MYHRSSVEVGSLKGILMRLHAENPQGTLVIQADKLSVNETLVQVMDAARQAGIKPADCLYIGDAERDIVAGKAAGMSTLAARYGYLTESDNPSAWDADGIVDSPTPPHNTPLGRKMREDKS